VSQISVLIPCYNEALYIREAVKSVVNQSFRDWELVIVDDGSDDGSSEELDSILTSFSQYPISVVNQPHRGCAAATKLAIENASSPLCTILDGDDEFDPSSLQVVVDFFFRYPKIDFAWSKYRACSDGSTHWKLGRSKPLPPNQTLRQALLDGWWGALAQRSFRREAYFRTKGLDPRLPFAVDQQLAALFAELGCEVAHIPVVTYYHLQHSKQMSAQHYKDQQQCRRKILERLGGRYVKEK